MSASRKLPAKSNVPARVYSDSQTPAHTEHAHPTRANRLGAHPGDVLVVRPYRLSDMEGLEAADNLPRPVVDTPLVGLRIFEVIGVNPAVEIEPRREPALRRFDVWVR